MNFYRGQPWTTNFTCEVSSIFRDEKWCNERYRNYLRLTSFRAMKSLTFFLLTVPIVFKWKRGNFFNQNFWTFDFVSWKISYVRVFSRSWISKWGRLLNEIRDIYKYTYIIETYKRHWYIRVPRLILPIVLSSLIPNPYNWK